MFSVHAFILFYHYQRQNLGVIALVNGVLSAKSKKTLNVLLLLPVIPAAVIWASRLDDNLLGDLAATGLPRSLIIAQIAVSVVFLFRTRKEQSLQGAVVTALGLNFFAPFFIMPDNILVAFLVFALTHGAQYLVIMGFVSAGSGQARHASLIVFCILLGILLLDRAAFGVVMAFTWTHFLIDARIWKMRNTDARRYIMPRIGRFLSPTRTS